MSIFQGNVTYNTVGNAVNPPVGGYIPNQQQVFGGMGQAVVGQVQNNMVYTGNQWQNAIFTGQHEISVFRNGKTINICETLERIMNVLNMIMPDKKLLNEYPALQEAYDHYNQKVNEALNSADVKAAYDSYKIIEIMITESQ